MLNVRACLYLFAVIAIGAIALVGCSNQSKPQPTAATATSADWKAGLAPDVVEALSQLSNEDRVAALKQKICPVTDNPLGSMGAPPKVTVEGWDVFLCCDGCEEELKSNAAKYVAKLDEKE